MTRANADPILIGGGLLVGAGAVAYNVNQLSLRQALCPLRLQGRMNATVRFAVWGTMPLGALVGSALGTGIGVRPTLWVAGIGTVAALGWILLSPVPRIVAIPAGATVETRT